jgi:nitroreductase
MNKVFNIKPNLQTNDTEATVLEAILSRHSVSPKRVVSPGPSHGQIMQLMAAAAAAPDHGKLQPWRFIEFPENSRADLSDVFAAALLERLPNADDEAIMRAREKASRAPVLLGLVLRLNHQSDVPHVDDQLASGGAALQNVLLAVHAMGFGARALSGQAVRTSSFRAALKLDADETFLCFIAIGTPTSAPKSRLRANPETLLTRWDGTQ